MSRILPRLIALPAVVLAACDGPSTQLKSEPTGPKSSATLILRDTTLVLDETAPLPVVARAEDGHVVSNAVITWRSSSPSTVAVDSVGRARGLALGEATVTAVWNNLEVRATITVSPQFVRIAPGELHTCGISGRGEVYCWGLGLYGNLGLTSEEVPDCGERYGPDARCTAVPIRLRNVRAVEITSGGMHTCALDANGGVVCWGGNSYGQTGSGRSTGGPAPTPVAGDHRFVHVTAGRMHTCGITTSLDAYCWGVDDTGQLGAGDVSTERCTFFPGETPCSRKPRLVVGGHKWTQLATSGRKTCGLTIDGEIYCWGLEVGATDGLYCQSLSNLVGCTRVPFRIGGAKRYRAVDVGDVHVCQQAIEGTIECWGANYWGMFGNGTVATSATPVPAGGGRPYSSFVLFHWGVCALSEGEAHCWGHGTDGEIGNGSMQDALAPTAVAGNYRFTALETNGTSSVVCGLADTGRAYCWGHGVFGQLGNGTFLVSGVPTQVQLVREQSVAAEKGTQ